MSAGCPDSIRDMSGSGPLSPILNGVWQSLQTAIVTRYLPRATIAAFEEAPAGLAAGLAAGAACPRPAAERPIPTPTAITAAAANANVFRIPRIISALPPVVSPVQTCAATTSQAAAARSPDPAPCS